MDAQPQDSLRTPSDEEIPDLLAALADEGIGIAAFARARGLHPWKLYRAKREQGGSEGGATRKRALDLVPVRVTDRPSRTFEPLELVLSSGHRLRIPADFDEPSLRRLMGVLASC